MDYTGEVQTIPDQQMEDEIVTQIDVKVEKAHWAKSATNAESERWSSPSKKTPRTESHYPQILQTRSLAMPKLLEPKVLQACHSNISSCPDCDCPERCTNWQTALDAPSGPTTAAGASKERPSLRWRPFGKHRARLLTINNRNVNARRHLIPAGPRTAKTHP